MEVPSQKKHMDRILRKLCLTTCFIVASSKAWAVCPPVVPCKPTGEASTIVGSNADQELIMLTQNIATSTNQVALSLVDMANANASALQQNSQNIISTTAEMSQIQLGQELKMKQAISSRDMAHQAELSEQKYRQQVSVVSKDDTKEEFDVIIEALEQNTSLPVPRIVNILRVAFDESAEGKVLVPIKGAAGVCADSDVKNKGLCAIPKKIYPSVKLQSLFKECSSDKRLLKSRQKGNSSRSVAIGTANKKTANAMDSTNASGAVSSRMQKQRVLSCNPGEFKNKLCGEDISIEDYQEKIVIGDIIPNGSVSASNFSSPSVSSADGFIDDLSESERAEVRSQSLDRTGLQNYPDQKIVPVINTYKNANQVKASMDFIDNLVGDDLVPALAPNARQSLSNAEYQSRYMARIAALSMVRLSLNESMSMRLGEKMKSMIKAGTFDQKNKFNISMDSPENKESVLGAGLLDTLNDRVSRGSGAMQLGSQSGDSSSAGNDFVANPSETDTLGQILEGMVLQNDLAFQEYLMNEQRMSLQSIRLIQLVNSKEAVELMDGLRRESR